ncbi:hypothetical protein CRI70_11375, partial [Streptomyces sp. Ru87]
MHTPQQESGRPATATTPGDRRAPAARDTGGSGLSDAGASLAGPPPAGPDARQLLALQQSAGNAAVTRLMLQRGSLPPIAEEPAPSAARRRRPSRLPGPSLAPVAEEAET